MHICLLWFVVKSKARKIESIWRLETKQEFIRIIFVYMIRWSDFYYNFPAIYSKQPENQKLHRVFLHVFTYLTRFCLVISDPSKILTYCWLCRLVDIWQFNLIWDTWWSDWWLSRYRKSCQEVIWFRLCSKCINVENAPSFVGIRISSGNGIINNNPRLPYDVSF